MLSSLLPSSFALLAEADLTIGIEHYGFRREQLDRLLRSIRRRYAMAEVIVADDGCKADRTVANTHNVTLVCTEAGSGLGLGRNAIVRRARTEFMLLLDDDVVFSEATDLAALHAALVRDPGAALAGGCYDDLEGGDADCFNLAFSVTGGGTAVAARFATLQAQGGGCGVVGATHNFFLARRSALVQHGWDARQKLMEHQAFFYALWLHGLRVLACPAVRVQHPRKRGPRAWHAGVRQTAQRLGDRGRTSLKSNTPELGLLHAGHAVALDPGVTLRHGTTPRGSTSSSAARQREADYLQYLCRNFPRIDSWATPWWTVDCGAHTFKSINDESPTPLAWDASDDTSIVAHTLRDDLGLFVLVLSAQGRAAARDTLRQSWIRIFGRGSGAVHGMRWDYGFFLGGAGADAAAIGAGAASPAPLMRGDIVRLASPDGYGQLGEKVVAALAWSVAHVKSRFILKCDEDSFVHVAKINEYLAGLGAAAAAALYAGQVVVAPVRRTGKWGVPAEVFPAAQYPPYAKGGGYLLSIDVARRIVPEIQTGRSPLLSNVEDAMVGVAADRLAMSATGLNHHFRELSLDIAAVRAASALHCCSSDTMLYHKPAKLAVCDACWAAGGLEPDTQAADAAAYEHFKNGASSKCFGVLPATTRAKVPVAASFFHVLTFMVVGRKEAVNVQATCDVLSGVANVSFFYAHYDDAQPWYAKQAWYRRCARDHVAYRENVKSRFVVNAIASRGSAWAETYSHVWIIDEDVWLPPLRYVRHFLRESHGHGALISQPAIYGSVWSLLRPHPRCATRATDFVELMLPLLQTRVALDVFTRLYRSEATTDWGLDITWCKYAASRFVESPACIVVNAGRFVHPTGNTTANYSRRSGQEDFLCMRAMHAALVSEPKNLACLHEDRYNSLDPVLTDATLAPAPAAHHAPAAIEASRHRPLKMYVYRLKHFGSKDHCISLRGGGAHDFEWELHVESNLRATFAVTADPSQADFFLLPACLNRLWASGWRWSEAQQRLRACVECTSRFERKLLHVMRAVGPWYDEHPEKHLVTRHRCPYIGEQSWASNAGEEVYTELWRHPRLRYICLETDPEPPPGAVRDWHREVHVPYFVDAATMQSPLPHAKRAHDFGFAGSLCCGRGWLKELLQLDERVELRDHTGSAANATRLLRTASFAVEPRGDMPERRIIYEALHAGTPLVFTSPVAPPLRLLSWDGVAIEAGASLWHGAKPLPTLRSHDVQRALAHYDKWMASFEAAREIFIWGTPAFRRRLELVVADVITQ